MSIDLELNKELQFLSKETSNFLESKFNILKDGTILLSILLAKKDAPRGSGSAFMLKLISIADKYKRIIVLHTPVKGFGLDYDKSDKFKFKTTSSIDRLKRFYKRFGFVNKYSKKTYRPDLDGNMYRLPKKS